MAQEGIATLPQAPENQASAGQPMSFSQDLSSIKSALANQDPESIAQYDQGMEAAIQSINVPVEELQALLEGVEYILKNEKEYPQIRQQLISSGVADEEDLPEQFDRGYFTTMLVVAQEAINRKQGGSGISAMGGMDQMGGMPTMPQPPQGFAAGGLAGAAEALRQKGRGGDTILAHINPQEARMLKSMGGAGTINPATGLLEFKGGPIAAVGKAIGGAAKAVGNAVKSVVSSPIGRIVATVALTVALGPAGLGMSTMLAAGLAGTAVSLAGGSNLKTALISGVTSGAMAGLAPGISDMLPGAGGYLNAAATGAIMGAGYGAATGQNLKQIGMSALTGGALAGAMSYAQGAGATARGAEGQGGVFSRAEPAPVVDNSTVLPGSDGISTLPTGTTNLTAPTNAVGSYGPDTGFATPTAPSSNVAGSYGPDTGFPAPTPSVAGGYGPDTGFATPTAPSSLPTPTAPSSAAGGYGPDTGFSQNQAPSQPSTGIGGFYDKAKDYLFSSDPKNPGFFYNSKGEISIPAVTGTVLAGTALMDGFTPTQPAPPGIVDRNVTGETLVDRDPSRYIVGDIPNFNTTQPNMPPVTYTAAPQYGRSAIPTYTPPTGTTTATNYQPIQQPYNNPYNYSFMPRVYAANGGITNVYPRKTGQINGPGTGTSDSIPAMLSDGEFVLTAKAVKGIGNGSRRSGAKKLYRMMHAMEKKAGGKV
jgi:hypothetical protein